MNDNFYIPGLIQKSEFRCGCAKDFGQASADVFASPVQAQVRWRQDESLGCSHSENRFLNHERYMHEALKEAALAFEKGEVPVGAILVRDDRIVAAAHNCVEEKKDASCHAEIEVLRMASRELGSWRLTGCTLYCTLEPCAMCAGAMTLFRIDRLVYGAPDHRHGALGSWVDLFREPHPIHSFEITGGILEEKSSDLLKSFFQMRRKQASCSSCLTN